MHCTTAASLEMSDEPQIYLVFRSLIRTFNLSDFRYSRSEKLKYIWFFARLFVPLNPCKDKYADAVIIFPHY